MDSPFSAASGETTKRGHIDPKELIAKLSVEEFNQYSDLYYKRMPSPEVQMGKPFSIMSDLPRQLMQIGLLIEGMELAPTMRVLDFGAGTGWLSKMLWQCGCSVVATDVAPEALRLARQLFDGYAVPQTTLGKCETLLFDGHKIELPDAAVDRIICYDTFHHVPNQATVIAEFFRVLKPGGIAAFCEPLGEHSNTPASQKEMREFTMLENDLHAEELEELFTAAGFSPPTYKLCPPPNLNFSTKQRDKTLSRGFRDGHERDLLSALRLYGVFFYRKGAVQPDSRKALGLVAGWSDVPTAVSLRAGEEIVLPVVVRNAGTALWIAENDGRIGEVKLGGAWLDPETGATIDETPRPALVADLAPGESFTFHLPLMRPLAGTWQLRLDLVAEHVAWFGDLDSAHRRVEIAVTVS